MKKADIQKISLSIAGGGEIALAMELSRDGSILRQGNGHLPPEKVTVIGMTDGAIFRKLVEMLDENIISHAATFDHPDKSGIPLVYRMVFLGEEPHAALFEFRLGTATPKPGGLLPYFDGYVAKAVALTQEWYLQAKARGATDSSHEENARPWWKLW